MFTLGMVLLVTSVLFLAPVEKPKVADVDGIPQFSTAFTLLIPAQSLSLTTALKDGTILQVNLQGGRRTCCQL